MDKVKQNRANVKKYLANPDNKVKIYRTRTLTKLRKGESVRASTLLKYGLLETAQEKYPNQITGKIPKIDKIDVKGFFEEPEPVVIDLVSPTGPKIDVKGFFSDSESDNEKSKAKSKSKKMSLSYIIKLINEIPESTLKSQSKKTYINKLNAIKRYAGCDEDDFIDCFNNAEKTVPLILKEAPVYGIQYLAVFKSLIKYLPEFAAQFSPNIIKNYEEAMKKSADAIEDHIQSKKKIPPTAWSKFTHAADQAAKIAPNSYEHLITALYTQIPPVRDDFGSVRITNKELDEGNYYNTKTKKLHLKEYKTSGKYGEQVFALPSSLSSLINKTLLEKPRNYLFTKLDPKKPFGKMSSFIKKTFAKFGDIPSNKAGLNHIRHSRISHEYAKNDTNAAAKRKLARRMLHSVDIAAEMYLHQNVLTGEDE